jgi:FkbH-like protein
MKLSEALRLSQSPAALDAGTLDVYLACGFTPLHLPTFLAAHLRRAIPDRGVAVGTGLFGDLHGNIQRLGESGADAGVVIVEWSDLDPRLGLRRLGGWGHRVEEDLVESAVASLGRLSEAVLQAGEHLPVAVILPTLPLPPAFSGRPRRAQSSVLKLRHAITEAALAFAGVRSLKLLDSEHLDTNSDPSNRLDVRMELSTGFPYTLAHASSLSAQIAALLHPRAVKKGLVTDLDDTLWAGLVGEVGASEVHWDLEHGAQVHGLYQQLLASLAGSGTLVAVASKNDPEVVRRSFERDDLLIQADQVFPFEVHWEPKSRSVSRILDAWNIGPEAIVFVDDSERELAEVNSAHPDVDCLRFDSSDPAACYRLLEHLRDLFAKDEVSEEDRIRTQSLRRERSVLRERETASSEEEFLSALQSSIRIEKVTPSSDPRALELINKTNQFNLNGRRLTEGEWTVQLEQPGRLAGTVSYRDRYGPLGKIAVFGGARGEGALELEHWVMSCRAFSRRVEHACLARLFEMHGVDRIVFDFQETERNGPLRDFLCSLLGEPPVPGCELTRAQFQDACPPLYHDIETDADE